MVSGKTETFDKHRNNSYIYILRKERSSTGRSYILVQHLMDRTAYDAVSADPCGEQSPS